MSGDSRFTQVFGLLSQAVSIIGEPGGLFDEVEDDSLAAALAGISVVRQHLKVAQRRRPGVIDSIPRWIISAADNVKAAAAALADGDVAAATAAVDDARRLLWELLSEGPVMSERDRRDIESAYRTLNQDLELGLGPSAIRGLDAVHGSLARIADRWTA